jgi:hypothetical protein
MQVQKRLLHQIMSLLRAAQISGHGPLEERRVTLEELAKGRLFAGNVGGHQLFVRAHGRMIATIWTHFAKANARRPEK